jgi:hypothetical protein
MTTRKMIIWAVVSALLIEFFCFVLFLGCPLFGPVSYIGIWLLYPAMYIWGLLVPITPDGLNVIVLLLLPFFQFFVITFIILRFKKGTVD